TRMKDVLIDLVAMPCAWWRVTAARRLPHGVPRGLAYYGLPLFFGAAICALLVMLTQPLYLANDTINNYAHVWYISHSLFTNGDVPLRFSGLDDGRAFTFPYGLVPWTANALVYPVLGDWSVTLFLVLAGVAVAIGATDRGRPRCRCVLRMVLRLPPVVAHAGARSRSRRARCTLAVHILHAAHPGRRRELAGDNRRLDPAGLAEARHRDGHT